MQPERKVSSGSTGSSKSRQQEGDDSSFQDLLGAMDGSSVFGALANGIFQIIGSSVKLQAMTKLALIEVFGQLRGDMAQMEGLPPEMKRLFEVLIRERNKVVIADLKEELPYARRADSIAIFYGAGHLADMEKRLRRELRYVPVEEFWLPVFSVNTEKAGLSDFELTLLRSVLRSQLAPLSGR
jgi:pheromone shutdown protein TraB